MTIKAGIWIDREHAYALLLGQNRQDLKSFHAGDSGPFPATTQTRRAHDYTRNDFVAEDRLERKESTARNGMYDEVLNYLGDVEALYVLGPGEAKKEFQKHVTSKGLSKITIELETSGKMTAPQLTAKIHEHFKD